MFILFFGTRPGRAITKLLRDAACSYCERTNTLTATITPNYFHIFWLPVFTVSKIVFAECSHCKRSYYRDEFTGEMENALKL